MAKVCFPTCPKEDCKDFFHCEDHWGGFGDPHPCAGCLAFNHAEKCADTKSVDCKLERI